MPMTAPTQACLPGLPNELFIFNANLLDGRSMATLSRTCRRFRVLFKEISPYLQAAHYFCPADTSPFIFAEKIKKAIQAIRVNFITTGKTPTQFLFEAILADDAIGTIAAIKAGASITSPRDVPDPREVLLLGPVTPLFFAAYRGRINALEVLLKLGKVDPNKTIPFSDLTPLFAAAASGAVQCAEKLVEYGANLRYRAKSTGSGGDITAYEYAIARKQSDVAAALQRLERKAASPVPRDLSPLMGVY